MENFGRISIDKFNTETFFKLYKFLFEDEYFSKMSDSAKIAYALLRDRFELSKANDWIDEDNNIYLVFTTQELCKYLNCGTQKVTKIKKELEKYNLMEQERTGLNRPNKIYMLEPKTTSEPNSDKEFRKSKFRNFENQNSRVLKIKNQEFRKSKSNKTELNKTYNNKTEFQQHHHKKDEAPEIQSTNKDNHVKKSNSKTSGDGGAYTQVLNTYKKSFGEAPSKYISEKLEKDIETYDKDLIIYAIHVSAENGKAFYGYVQGILKRLDERNIKSKQEAEAYVFNNKQTKQVRSKELTPEWLNKDNKCEDEELSAEEQAQLKKEAEEFKKQLSQTWK